MSLPEKILEELYNPLKKWLLFSYRKILFIPLVYIALAYWLVQKINPAINFQQTLINPIFFYGTIVAFSLSVIWFLLVTHLPPQKNTWCILITKFYSVANTEKEKMELEAIRDRIITELKKRLEDKDVEFKIKETKIIFDHANKFDYKLAKKLGRWLRANAVLCGRIRFDDAFQTEDYDFEPMIIQLGRQNINEKYFKLDPLIVPSNLLESDLKEAKIKKREEIVDVINIISALSFFNKGNHKKFINQIKEIKNWSTDVSIYASKAYLCLNELNEAKRIIAEVLEQNQSSAEAYFTQGLILIEEKDWENAMVIMNKVIKIDPMHIAAGFSTLISGMNVISNELQKVNYLLSLNKKKKQRHKFISQEFAMLRLGQDKLNNNEFEEASECFKKVLDIIKNMSPNEIEAVQAIYGNKLDLLEFINNKKATAEVGLIESMYSTCTAKLDLHDYNGSILLLNKLEQMEISTESALQQMHLKLKKIYFAYIEAYLGLNNLSKAVEYLDKIKNTFIDENISVIIKRYIDNSELEKAKDLLIKIRQPLSIEEFGARLRKLGQQIKEKKS